MASNGRFREGNYLKRMINEQIEGIKKYRAKWVTLLLNAIDCIHFYASCIVYLKKSFLNVVIFFLLGWPRTSTSKLFSI